MKSFTQFVNDRTSEVEHLTEGGVYHVVAVSDSIRALMKVPNVSRADIRTRMEYGGGFPKKVHEVVIDSFNEQQVGGGAIGMARELRKSLPKIPRVTYTVQ